MNEAHSAKRKMLENLKREMSKNDDGGLKDILPKLKQKVVVASDSPVGLKKGLDKAQEILEKRMDLSKEVKSEDLDEAQEEANEIDDSEIEEKEENDPAILKAKIAELKAQLARK